MVEFDRAVRLAVAGIPAGRFKDSDGEQYDIIVRTPIDARADLRALDQVRVATLQRRDAAAQPARARRVQLRADQDRSLQPRARRHDQRGSAERLQHRSCDADVLQRLDQMQWPRGYSYVPGGELETRNESFGGTANRHHRRAARHHRGPRARVRQFQEHADRPERRAVRHRGRHHRARADRQHDLVHGDDRLHRADRHRDEELDPARRLHQSTARTGRVRSTRRSSAPAKSASCRSCSRAPLRSAACCRWLFRTPACTRRSRGSSSAASSPRRWSRESSRRSCTS